MPKRKHDAEQKNKEGFDSAKTDSEYSRELQQLGDGAGSAAANRVHKSTKNEIIQKPGRMERNALKTGLHSSGVRAFLGFGGGGFDGVICGIFL